MSMLDGTVKDYAQISLKSGRAKSARGQETALDIRIAEGRTDVKGGEAACEALDV